MKNTTKRRKLNLLGETLHTLRMLTARDLHGMITYFG